MRTAAKISRQPIGRWDMGGNKMIAITACAAALAAVTVGLLLRSEYEKKHFVTDPQYEIESPKLRTALRSAAYFCRICMIMCMERTMSRWWQRSAHSSQMRC